MQHFPSVSLLWAWFLGSNLFLDTKARLDIKCLLLRKELYRGVNVRLTDELGGVMILLLAAAHLTILRAGDVLGGELACGYQKK